MFKSLGRKLNERSIHVQRTQEIQCRAEVILRHYAITATVRYDHDRDILTIEAQTKTGASELFLHVADITELLQHTGCGVRRICIR